MQEQLECRSASPPGRLMNYKNVQIYFISGTGNSLQVSRWLAEEFHNKGAKSKISPITAGEPADPIDHSEDTLVVLANPTHGFITPWSMIKFAAKMPRTRAVHACSVATRAGWFVGPWRLPGIAGWAAFLTAMILFFKGYKLRGVISADMPTNWLQLHWGMKEKNNNRIFEHTRPRISRFVQRISAGKSNWFTLNNLWELVWALALGWISLVYLFFARFFIGKFFFADRKCTGCGICRDYCPVGAIVLATGNEKNPYWKFTCEACMRCMAFCPSSAVQAGWPWAILIFFLTGIPLFKYLVSWLAPMFPFIRGIDDSWIGIGLNALCAFPVVFLSYYIFHQLCRVPIINKFLSYTTPTSFWRRYRAPDIKLNDLKKKE